MPSLTDLPAELLQQILLLTLPDTNKVDAPWPATIVSLFSVSQRIRLVMGTVIDRWSPLHYISFPSSISQLKTPTLTLNGRVHSPRVQRICLDLFHESAADRIKWTCYCGDASTWTHPELIRAWTDAVPFLPLGLEEVWLDVTPAPAVERGRRQYAIDRFVRERCAARKFLAGHVRDVAALVRSIETHQGRSTCVLAGRLSVRSEFFVESLRAETARDLHFVGTWVQGADVQFAIRETVKHMTSRKQMWIGKRRGDSHPLVWLRDVVWDRKTDNLFAILAHAGHEMRLVDEMRMIAAFKAAQNGEELKMPPQETSRRAFYHRVAVDLGMKTFGEGEGDDRHVVVRR